ncbi:hypothetical protein MSAN_01513900 [Mycena sanguinolenta]|uniref:Uncharacterized protein n=1 Tax=Mycena sanguinolenta TaxID=230812 RepID=A0A8H7CWU4_9AGAR|nr:hypothetical protein MSAN_01513900 [Mycena sanguinolenta]
MLIPFCVYRYSGVGGARASPSSGAGARSTAAARARPPRGRQPQHQSERESDCEKALKMRHGETLFGFPSRGEYEVPAPSTTASTTTSSFPPFRSIRISVGSASTDTTSSSLGSSSTVPAQVWRMAAEIQCLGSGGGVRVRFFLSSS